MANVTKSPGFGFELDVAPLRSRVCGQVIEPRTREYDHSRSVWNGMIDKYPAVIVQPDDELDIQRSIEFAAARNLPVSSRGGGHNVAGLAVSDGGLTLDLSSMRSVHVDPVRQRAFVEGGALWGDFDAATAEFELATTGGVISSTGVGGLTLCGGIGWLVGKHGMSIDNLRGASIVTASGEIVKTNELSHPDLFWAIRGGGGNFGVAASLEFQLHEVSNVLAGYFMYPIDVARPVLEFCREFTSTAPRELGLYFELSFEPESASRVVALGFFWPDSVEHGLRLAEQIRAFKEPLAYEISVMPYADWQTAFDEQFPSGRRYYWKSSMTSDIGDPVIDAIVDCGSEPPLHLTSLVVEWYRGAMNDVSATATAFAGRNVQYQVIAVGAWEEASDDVIGKEWARNFNARVEPHSISASFLNFNSVEGDERSRLPRQQFGQNWDRLVKVKRRYDPDNVFRVNNNIPPG